MNTHFFSCDWGTTNFRLRLVSRDDLRIQDEVESDDGVKGLAKAWAERKTNEEDARTGFYTDVLRRAVEELKSRNRTDFQNVPVVISGMASSTLGITELPYAPLPVSTTGSGFRTRIFPATENFPHPFLLISGLRDGEEDVMRGEETQLIGCLTPEMELEEGEQLVIHPGTHSKHISIRNAHITSFRTFMTGESFKLYGSHSILGGSMEEGPLDAAAMPHFEAGVQAALSTPLMHALFGIRTADLFKRRDRVANFHYLSGLLIGAEMSTLRADDGVRKYLCAGPALHCPYTSALHVLGLEDAVKSLPPEWEEGSVIRGQAKVLAQQMDPL